MTTRRSSFAPSPRPSSAIFIGTEAILPSPSPPSPSHSASSTRSQLPSPPATNSTGSIGDNNSTGTGSIRRSGMVTRDNHPSLSDEDDDNDQENDEDHTAKLSNDRRTAKGKQPESSSSAIQRVKSLTERNRKVIDKLSSMTASDSHPRSTLSTPSSATSSRSRSPIPPTFSSSSSSATSSASRVSFAARGGSGSETERENPNKAGHGPLQDHSSDDNDGTTPPASATAPTFERTGPRQRLRSAPSPAKPPIPLSPRKHTSTTNFAVIGSGRRSRRVSIQQPEDVEEEEESPTRLATGGSVNKKARAPLPREFRDRRSLDGRPAGEPSTGHTHERERTSSPGVLTAQGSASANSSGAGGTFSASPASPRSQRPARPSTVRESTRRVHRWNSVDESVINGDDEGRRQWRHAGSAESPLGREGRSVVGEGLRAAGLARRGSEDVFVDGVPQRRARNSVNLAVNGTSAQGELDELRRGITRGLGLPEDPRDPRPPLTAPLGGSRYGAGRSNTSSIHSVLSNSASRAGTSLGSYADDDAPRATSQPLRSHRTSYGPGARHTPQMRASPAAGTFGRSTPAHQVTSPPTSEHARLMLDSLAMFEAQLGRLPPGTPDLARVAHSVVQSASGLNTLLRAGNARALEAQIEAEVGDAEAHVDASEVWRQVGGEYRESVRVSDELVRTVTALLLGVGRLVREATRERSSASPDVGGGGSGRSSLDGDRERERDRAPRRSMDGDGRQSVEGSVYRESRRSWEDTGSVRRGHVDLNSRPSTSLSFARGATRQDDGSDTARERDRSSALERLSLRRMFTPRSRESNHASPVSLHSPDPSPTPAPREQQHRHTLPPLAMPPPLPSLPSESQLDRKGSASIKAGRRSKVSNTSNATVRGASLFPSMTSPPNPTTALSPHTATAGEAMAFPQVRGESSTSTLSGLQRRDVRTRTNSAASIDEGSLSTSSAASGTRAGRGTRVRMSLDGAEAAPDYVPHTPANGDRRERRRTITDIFP